MTGQLYVFYRPDPDSSSGRPRKNPLCARAGSDLCPLLYNRRRRPVLCFPQSVDSAHPQKGPEDPGTVPGSCRNLRHDPADTHSGLVLHHRFHRPYRQSGLCDDPARAGFKRSFFRRWEDIYDNFVGGGTPYYISSFDGHYYLTEHRIPGHSVWQFDVIDNALTDIRALF